MVDERSDNMEEFVFKPASVNASPDIRMAVAMEFIAKHVGEISRSVDHLNKQMDDLINATGM